MDYIKKSVCGVVGTGRHYELIRLKIRYLKLILEEFLQSNLKKHAKRFMRCVVKSLTALRKHRLGLFYINICNTLNTNDL